MKVSPPIDLSEVDRGHRTGPHWGTAEADSDQICYLSSTSACVPGESHAETRPTICAAVGPR